MTTKEFSTEFDILYNNIMSDMAPGLNEYEKSVFLTQAQDALTLELYRGNNFDNGFEDSEEVRRHLSPLVRTEEFVPHNSGTILGSNYYTVYLPKNDILAILHERLEPSGKCLDKMQITPITHDTLNYYLKNPFLGVQAGDILRLEENGNINLIGDIEKGGKYIIRYLKKPYPIILEDIGTEGLSINGYTVPLSEDTPSELPPILHRQILMNAVQIAKAVWKS